MSLAEAPEFTKLKVTNITSCNDCRRKLFSMGIYIDDFVMKQNGTKTGPVLIQNVSTGATRIALGRGIAEKIFVEYET